MLEQVRGLWAGGGPYSWQADTGVLWLQVGKRDKGPSSIVPLQDIFRNMWGKKERKEKKHKKRNPQGRINTSKRLRLGAAPWGWFPSFSHSSDLVSLSGYKVGPLEGHTKRMNMNVSCTRWQQKSSCKAWVALPLGCTFKILRPIVSTSKEKTGKQNPVCGHRGGSGVWNSAFLLKIYRVWIRLLILAEDLSFSGKTFMWRQHTLCLFFWNVAKVKEVSTEPMHMSFLLSLPFI